MCALRLKSNLSINLYFLVSIIKHVWRLRRLAVTQRVNYVTTRFLKNNNVNKVAKVILALFKIANH